MEDIIVPIFVCVVLPVAIVLIITLGKININNQRTQIIIKAIEANKDVDTEKLIESMKRPQKDRRQILNNRLLVGCIFTFLGTALELIGIVNLIVGASIEEDKVAVPMIFGGIPLSIGISFLIVYFKTHNDSDSSDSDQTK